MGYTVAQLVTKFREEMEDTASPYLWSEAEILDYIDQAQRHFCKDTQMLKGEITVPVAATKSTVDLEVDYLDIRRAQLDSESAQMSVLNFNQLDNDTTTTDYGNTFSGDWVTKTGTPRVLVLDMIYEAGRLVPIPTATDTLRLWITEMPSEIASSAGSDSFDIKDKDHQRSFLYYARSLGYDKHDSETYNEAESEKYMAKYSDYVDTVNGEQKRNRRSTGTVQYSDV